MKTGFTSLSSLETGSPFFTLGYALAFEVIVTSLSIVILMMFDAIITKVKDVITPLEFLIRLKKLLDKIEMIF